MRLINHIDWHRACFRQLGNTFIGGLSVALVKGFPLKEAVRYASCAGTLAVTKFGAQTSLPSAEEVQTFYEGKDPEP